MEGSLTNLFRKIRTEWGILPPFKSMPLPSFPGWWTMLGPGIVWLALAQGSGELIWWPRLVAKYGLGFLRFLVPVDTRLLAPISPQLRHRTIHDDDG